MMMPMAMTMMDRISDETSISETTTGTTNTTDTNESLEKTRKREILMDLFSNTEILEDYRNSMFMFITTTRFKDKGILTTTLDFGGTGFSIKKAQYNTLLRMPLSSSLDILGDNSESSSIIDKSDIKLPGATRVMEMCITSDIGNIHASNIYKGISSSFTDKKWMNDKTIHKQSMTWYNGNLVLQKNTKGGEEKEEDLGMLAPSVSSIPIVNTPSTPSSSFSSSVTKSRVIRSKPQKRKKDSIANGVIIHEGIRHLVNCAKHVVIKKEVYDPVLIPAAVKKRRREENGEKSLPPPPPPPYFSSSSSFLNHCQERPSDDIRKYAFFANLADDYHDGKSRAKKIDDKNTKEERPTTESENGQIGSGLLSIWSDNYKDCRCNIGTTFPESFLQSHVHLSSSDKRRKCQQQSQNLLKEGRGRRVRNRGGDSRRRRVRVGEISGDMSTSRNISSISIKVDVSPLEGLHLLEKKKIQDIAMSVISYMNDMSLVPIISELAVSSEELGLATKIDLLAMTEDYEIAIVSIKTGSVGSSKSGEFPVQEIFLKEPLDSVRDSINTRHFIQLALEAILLEETHGVTVAKCFVIYACTETWEQVNCKKTDSRIINSSGIKSRSLDEMIVGTDIPSIDELKSRIKEMIRVGSHNRPTLYG
jgi:hypothetical protein